MHLRYAFETVELDDQIVAVPVGDSSAKLHAILKLNKTAAFIFELLKNDVTEEEIVEALLDEYDESREKIVSDTHKYVEDFKEKGLLA